MKRKLPQWLLDATNNNAKSPKENSPQTIRTNSNGSDNVQTTDSEPLNDESDQIQKNGTISVVPLANLLSQSRCGAQTNDSSESLHTANNTEEMHTAGLTTIGTLPVVIKTEKIDPVEPDTSNSLNELPQFAVKQKLNEPVGALDTASSTTTTPNERQQVTVKQEIKDELVDAVDTAVSTTTAPTIVPTPVRSSCNYGIKCFRHNPDHRAAMAHPGDADYRRPNLPVAPIGTPPCPWGAACYRRNPQHFLQLSHPPATANAVPQPNAVPQQNPSSRRTQNNAVNRPHRPPLSQRTPNNRMARDGSDSDTEYDYDLEDPFLDDGSSDEYVPNEDESDEDEDDTQELTE